MSIKTQVILYVYVAIRISLLLRILRNLSFENFQAFSSTLNGTLTTQAVMKGVGVGDQAATPLAAALTWILKDGAGNIGRIIFAWWKG